jgi:hypothetical protein
VRAFASYGRKLQPPCGDDLLAQGDAHTQIRTAMPLASTFDGFIRRNELRINVTSSKALRRTE